MMRVIAWFVLIPFTAVSLAGQTHLELAQGYVLPYAEQMNDPAFRGSAERSQRAHQFVEHVKALKNKREALALMETIASAYRDYPEYREGLEVLVPLVAQGRALEIQELNEYNYFDDFSDKFVLLLTLPLGMALWKSIKGRILKNRLNAARARYREFEVKWGKNFSEATAQQKNKLREEVLRLHQKRVDNVMSTKSNLLCSALFMGASAAVAGAWLGIESIFSDKEKYDPDQMLDATVRALVKSWEKRAFDLDNTLMDFKDGRIALDAERLQNAREELADLYREVDGVVIRSADGAGAKPKYLINVEPLQAKLMSSKVWLKEENLRLIQPQEPNFLK